MSDQRVHPSKQQQWLTLKLHEQIEKTLTHLKFVFYSLQTPKKIFCFVEDGEESRCIPIDHEVEDELLPMSTEPFKLIRNGDEALHLSEVASSHLFKWRAELQNALPISKERNG